MRTVSIPREQIFQGPLVLVNRAHPLHEKERSALTSVDPHHPDILLESRARQLLSACIQKAGGQREIVPVSGWRSQQEQQRIWDDSMAEHGETFTRQYVALPGCSEHQTGLAIDLGKAAGYIDFIRPAFPYDGVCGRFRRRPGTALSNASSGARRKSPGSRLSRGTSAMWGRPTPS
jgi:D-alanyl-D-alanine dipeptidase/carboxypeptidase